MLLILTEAAQGFFLPTRSQITSQYALDRTEDENIDEDAFTAMFAKSVKETTRERTAPKPPPIQVLTEFPLLN